MLTSAPRTERGAGGGTAFPAVLPQRSPPGLPPPSPVASVPAAAVKCAAMRKLLTVSSFAVASLMLAGCPSEKVTPPTPASNPAAGSANAPTGQAASNPAAGHAAAQPAEATPEPGDIPAPSDVAAAPADAEKRPSGLASKVIQKGTGTEHPTAEDTVKVHYTGWMTNGKMFDSSVKRGMPTEFPLNGVIPGWTEGVQLMVVGEKRRFWIPANMAYGDTPRRPGMPFGTLVFDVELISIKAAPKPIPAPADVAAAPKDAKKTASGLAYKVLTKGTGTKHPTAQNQVSVHYSGWTTDGKMFDSSVMRGEPTSFPLDAVIKGWTEGVQLMVEGEKTRFWIPAGLAYGENPRPGAPRGMLVFDVELLKILN